MTIAKMKALSRIRAYLKQDQADLLYNYGGPQVPRQKKKIPRQIKELLRRIKKLHGKLKNSTAN